ncbi:MAG: hypothetical protein M3326_02610 [Actinomycetota bacterium]|nr:hypothetical protein [Actinomycetota bacterium]
MVPAVHNVYSSPRRVAAVGVGAVLLGAMVARVSSVIALVVPTMIGILLLLGLVRGLIRWPDEAARRRILWWTMVAFAAHLIFGLGATNISREIRFYLGTDSFSYDNSARAIVQHWNHGFPLPLVPHGKEGFYYMLAGLYWVFGFHTAAGLAVNATLAAALVPVMSDATDRLFGPRAARYVPYLVVLLPGLFLWTSQLMREAGTLFLLAAALNCAVRLVERLSPAPLILLISTLLLAFTFRAWVALIVAAGLLVGLAVGHRQLLSGLGTGLSTFVIAAVIMVASGLGYSGYKTAVDVDLERANVVRKDLAYSGRTGYEADVDISTTRGALSYLPKGIVNFVGGPFPWSIGGARQLPFVPDMVAWWLVLPSLWRGFRAAGERVGRRRWLMALPAVGVILFMSLALGNFGTVVRERLQVIILLVPLIAFGISLRASAADEPPVGGGAPVAVAPQA